MIKKKTTKKPAEHDFSALDAAVSELSKQTDALLGKPEDSKPKKSTAKKKPSKPRTKGKSFDIIHDPKRPTRLAATLKTTATPAVAPEEHLLLEDHATKSFNETDTASSATVATEPVNSAPEIVQHKEGTLNLTEVDEPLAKDIVAEDTPAEDVPSGVPAARKTLVFDAASPKDAAQPEPEPKEKEEVVGAAEAKSKETTKPSEPAPDTSEEESVEEPPAEDTGELYANNLVKQSEPKGYQPDENQQKPTVFDTNEYHPELHDWSKLEHRGGWKWLTLVLLLTVAGGLIYIVLSGQELPF